MELRAAESSLFPMHRLHEDLPPRISAMLLLVMLQLKNHSLRKSPQDFHTSCAEDL